VLSEREGAQASGLVRLVKAAILLLQRSTKPELADCFLAIEPSGRKNAKDTFEPKQQLITN